MAETFTNFDNSDDHEVRIKENAHLGELPSAIPRLNRLDLVVLYISYVKRRAFFFASIWWCLVRMLILRHLLKIESRKRMDRLLRGASLTFGLPGTLELPWCSRDVFRVPVSPIMPDPVG